MPAPPKETYFKEITAAGFEQIETKDAPASRDNFYAEFRKVQTGPDNAHKNESPADGLVVYFFHSNTRCPNCLAIESQTRETVQTDFAAQLNKGEMTWRTLNYEQPAAAQLAKKFEIQMPVVVLARVKGGDIQEWKRLDRVWALVGDKPVFTKFIQAEIKQMLASGDKPTGTAPKAPESVAPKRPPETPVPE